MSLLGELLGVVAEGSTERTAGIASVDPQRESEAEAAFDFLYVTVQWLAAEISRQFPVSFDAAFGHLIDMPDEHIRYLATPFGWTWLAHDTVRALGVDDGFFLKTTVH